MKVVECVPNFSEGRNKATIDAIADAIQSVEGVELLDVDPGADTNRTVMTFIGTPHVVQEGAFQAISRAAKLIDMRAHKGAHARIGATDVCPFVPVARVTMEECIELARELGERVSDELGIPVYLYEEAATNETRRNLAFIRAGEYEGLAKKLKDPAWVPDFGEPKFNAKTGATIIGAREFLIAYNFNLNTRDQKIAHHIALEIREAGRALRDEKGKIIRDENGRAVKKPGIFKHVKAVGWYMKGFHCAQVSMNLTNYKSTPLATVFEQICTLAHERGVRCTGSELVGLAPKDCLLAAGRHFLHKAGKSAGVPEKELIRVAVQSLGLGELYPFDASKKIIEYRLPDVRPLINMNVGDFVDLTSSFAPAPGGGSVAALVGALSCALSCMVAELTVGKKGYEQASESMKKLAEQAQVLKDFYIRAIDDDTKAFNNVMEAIHMPKKTDEQKVSRDDAIQRATKKAIEVPEQVIEKITQILSLTQQAAILGNKSSLSDAGVAALCAQLAARGAYFNVITNLASIKDKDYRERILNKCKRVLAEVENKLYELTCSIEATLLKRLYLRD